MTALDLHLAGPANSPEDAGLIARLSGLTADSRAVRPGFLFAALPGSKVDGRAFIGEALARGAVAVLAPTGTVLPAEAGAEVALIADDRPRRRFARLAAAFHGRQPETVVAVTGTNGKTSTVSFARQLWALLGRSAASLGTLGIVAPDGETPGSLTTPDPVTLHATLADLAERGVTHLAMEASSHGLDQERLHGVRLTAAGFTNLSHDHLDYHGTMAAYLDAKARLFEEVLPPGGTAVLNLDDPAGRTLAARLAGRSVRVIGYGRAGDALTLEAATPLAAGSRLTLSVFGRRTSLDLPVVGGFQVHNALCALGLVLADPAVDRDAAVAALGRLRGVRGRLEEVARHVSGAPVFVDYAHTPDALETVLTALRPHTAGRLIVVFGCGGDRDRAKRPAMGAIAARLADRAIVTDDNPRSEEPAAIRAAILAACPGAVEIGDRRAAIAAAVESLAEGDVLVIAGKGHESGQIVGNTVHPFDDAEVARAAVAALGDALPVTRQGEQPR